MSTNIDQKLFELKEFFDALQDTDFLALKTVEAALGGGEDTVRNVQKVEQRFTPFSPVTADTQIAAGSGFLHSLTFAQNDAAPTAGTIIVYDSLSETGTQLFNWTLTTTVFIPFTITLDVSFGTGLYVGFTTTADVNVCGSYRLDPT